MGQLYSKYFGDRVHDESTSNTSLSDVRYIPATIHQKHRWKSMFTKKNTLAPLPRLPVRPIPGTPHGCKTLITPRGVTMIYPQKRKFTPFRQKAEASPTGDRNYPNLHIAPKNRKPPTWTVQCAGYDNTIRKQITPIIMKRRFR